MGGERKIPKAPFHHLSLVLRKTKRKGWGIFAIAPIKKGEIVTVSRGKKIPEKQWRTLDTDDMCYQIGRYWHYCPLPYKNPDMSWYMNHSCEANVLPMGPRSRVMVAVRDIEKDEEIVYDYVITESGPEYAFQCSCNSKTCRKRFTGNDWKIPALQKRYKGYFEPYLQRKIDALRK